MNSCRLLFLACTLFLVPACGPSPLEPVSLSLLSGGFGRSQVEAPAQSKAAPEEEGARESRNSESQPTTQPAAGSQGATEPGAPAERSASTGDGSTILRTPGPCPTANDDSLDPSRVVQRETVKIRRHLQRVIRKDCEGRVLSDQVETVLSPNIVYDLNAKTLYFWDNVDVRSAYNRTTCDYGKYRDPLTHLLVTFIDLVSLNWGDVYISPRTIRMTLDTSPAMFHTYIDRNRINYIDYEFRRCDSIREENGVRSCGAGRVQEAGTLVLTVDYEETHLDGIKEVLDCDNSNEASGGSLE